MFPKCFVLKRAQEFHLNPGMFFERDGFRWHRVAIEASLLLLRGHLFGIFGKLKRIDEFLHFSVQYRIQVVHR